jgi:hypothetical protein
LTARHYSNSWNLVISFEYSWFLIKNFSNFVSLPWKLHSRYCHNCKTSWDLQCAVFLLGLLWSCLGLNGRRRSSFFSVIIYRPHRALIPHHLRIISLLGLSLGLHIYTVRHRFVQTDSLHFAHWSFLQLLVVGNLDKLGYCLLKFSEQLLR